MPLSKALLCCLLLLACSAEGEALPALRVNGVAMQVTRIEGADLAARVQEIETQWRQGRAATGPWREDGAWRVLSRRVDRWSEVLQVRFDGQASAAYLSRLDTRQRPAAVPVLPLPPGCRANSTVESADADARVVQATGPCRRSDSTETGAWARDLAAQGWRSGAVASQGQWRFQRSNTVLQVLRGDTWVMALQITSRAGP